MPGPSRITCARRILPLLLLLILPVVAQAQFEYTIDNGTVTIIQYHGDGGAVTIPDTIDGLPVMGIEYLTFHRSTGLTSSVIPDSVISIWGFTFTHSPAPATVRVQRSVNLVDWEDWQTVSKDEGPSELQDSEAGTTPYRFYRGVEE